MSRVYGKGALFSAARRESGNKRLFDALLAEDKASSSAKPDAATATAKSSPTSFSSNNPETVPASGVIGGWDGIDSRGAAFASTSRRTFPTPEDDATHPSHAVVTNAARRSSPRKTFTVDKAAVSASSSSPARDSVDHALVRPTSPRGDRGRTGPHGSPFSGKASHVDGDGHGKVARATTDTDTNGSPSKRRKKSTDGSPSPRRSPRRAVDTSLRSTRGSPDSSREGSFAVSPAKAQNGTARARTVAAHLNDSPKRASPSASPSKPQNKSPAGVVATEGVSRTLQHQRRAVVGTEALIAAATPAMEPVTVTRRGDGASSSAGRGDTTRVGIGSGSGSGGGKAGSAGLIERLFPSSNMSPPKHQQSHTPPRETRERPTSTTASLAVTAVPVAAAAGPAAKMESSTAASGWVPRRPAVHGSVATVGARAPPQKTVTPISLSISPDGCLSDAFSPPPLPEDDAPIATVPQRVVTFKVPAVPVSTVVPPSAAARPVQLKQPMPGAGLCEIVRVRDVGDASSVQEAGRNRKVAEDTGYLLDTLGADHAPQLRRTSMLRLAKLMQQADYRAHVQARGLLERIVTLLRGVADDAVLALPAAVLLLVLHHDPRHATFSAECVALLLQLVSSTRPPEPAATSGPARRRQLLAKRQSAKAREAALETIAPLDLQQPFDDPEGATSALLALETLCCVCAAADGAVLAEAQTEIRVLGGLDKVSQLLHADISLWGEDDGDGFGGSGSVGAVAPRGDALATALSSVSRSLRFLLESVRGNESNRTYVACLRDARLRRSLVHFVTACEQHLIAAVDDSIRRGACNAMCNAMKMLLGLTNNDAVGCGAFTPAAVSCLCRLAVGAAGEPGGIPSDYQHDLSSLATTLLINLTEYNADHRAAVTGVLIGGVDPMAAADAHDARMDTDAPFVPRLAAVVVSMCARPDIQAGLQSTRDQTFHNVAGAYAAILLGCVCQDNAEAITQARGVITVDDVDAVKKHLEDYLVFEQAAGMAQSTATVQRVMAVLSTFHS